MMELTPPERKGKTAELTQIEKRYIKKSTLNRFITNYLTARDLYLQGKLVTRENLTAIMPAIKASLELRLAS